MRIPIPIAVLLSIVTILVTWWLGTRKMDFLTPPTDIPAGVHSPVPKPAVSPAVEADDQQAVPDLTEQSKQEKPVPLETFADQAAMGPTHLTDLARNMEQAKWQHLAWLAWERVIDSTSASGEEIHTAQEAISSLRESISASQRVLFPQQPYSIILHAGTAGKMAGQVEALMRSSAKIIESASSGILSVSVRVASGPDPADTTGVIPVALWITGADDASRSSEVMSFTIGQDGDTRELLQHSLADLLRTLIPKPLSQPPAGDSAGSFQEEMQQCFTRYAWQKLGEWMNTPIEATPQSPQIVPE